MVSPLCAFLCVLFQGFQSLAWNTHYLPGRYPLIFLTWVGWSENVTFSSAPLSLSNLQSPTSTCSDASTMSDFGKVRQTLPWAGRWTDQCSSPSSSAYLISLIWRHIFIEMHFQFNDIFACCLILTFNIFSFLVEHKLTVSLMIKVGKKSIQWNAAILLRLCVRHVESLNLSFISRTGWWWQWCCRFVAKIKWDEVCDKVCDWTYQRIGQ